MSGKSSSQKFAEAEAAHGHRKGLTETQKAALGLPYFANEPALTRARLRARRIFHRFNATLPSPSDPPDLAEGEVPQGIGGSADAEAGEALDVMGSERRAIFAELLGVPKENLSRVEVEPPFWCDYGTNIELEGAFYCNFNTTILDCAKVWIGNGTVFGPNVHIYCGTHSVAVTERASGAERALPVKIGRDCWVGGNVSIMGGVTIGDGCTIGAGSVVTRDVPAFSIAVGNPARVVRALKPEERGNSTGGPTAEVAVDAEK